MDFNPKNALHTLRENAIKIQKMGEKLEELRTKRTLAKAKFMDAEQGARTKIFNKEVELPVSQQREWVKYQCHQEYKEYEILDDDVKTLRERLEILIEINNSLKAAQRMIEMEVKSLNLQ
jgi:hypothetical protein